MSTSIPTTLGRRTPPASTVVDLSDHIRDRLAGTTRRRGTVRRVGPRRDQPHLVVLPGIDEQAPDS